MARGKYFPLLFHSVSLTALYDVKHEVRVNEIRIVPQREAGSDDRTHCRQFHSPFTLRNSRTSFSRVAMFTIDRIVHAGAFRPQKFFHASVIRRAALTRRVYRALRGAQAARLHTAENSGDRPRARPCAAPRSIRPSNFPPQYPPGHPPARITSNPRSRIRGSPAKCRPPRSRFQPRYPSGRSA